MTHACSLSPASDMEVSTASDMEMSATPTSSAVVVLLVDTVLAGKTMTCSLAREHRPLLQEVIQAPEAPADLRHLPARFQATPDFRPEVRRRSQPLQDAGGGVGRQGQRKDAQQRLRARARSPKPRAPR